MHDHYNLLGVPRNASLEEIKAAFRRRAKAWHPDRNRDPNATARFREYVEAYECLSEPASRAAYDEALQRGEDDFCDFAETGSYSDAPPEEDAPPPPSPLDVLLAEWNARLALDPERLVALFANIEAWLGRVLAARRRRPS